MDNFENEMAKHGFLKDLNELSSFSQLHPSPLNSLRILQKPPNYAFPFQ